jgi:CubicO group peptidase (beta-lactamase class C family)
MKRCYILCAMIVATVATCQCRQIDLLNNVGDVVAYGLAPIVSVKGVESRRYTIEERMDFYKIPGVSIAIVKDGQLVLAKGYGIANAATGSTVGVNTLFQAGSISKPVAALAVLKLIEEGKVDLDTDVNTYLKGWKVPNNEFTEVEKVTLRRLLTHSAGMTVSGFIGYKPDEKLPSVEAVLNGEGNTPPIVVDMLPGKIERYSGGGYTVMEKLVEDVSGLPFEVYEERYVFNPIGMSHSTYEQPLRAELHPQASAAYDAHGQLIDGLWRNQPEKAAAGLWTTSSDLARYCIEIQEIVAGKSDGILSLPTVQQMLTRHKNNWGLGPSLKWAQDSLIFQHGGKNAGFTNTMVAFANRGDAVIIMTNADNGNRLIDEVLLAVSQFYNWGIAVTQTVELVDITSGALQKLAGKYKYNAQAPPWNDYMMEVSIDANGLTIVDSAGNESLNLHPTGAMSFIDLDKGDEVTFSAREFGEMSFKWSKRRYRFVKVD